VKASVLALVLSLLACAQEVEHLTSLVYTTPAYVGSDGSLYGISEVGCSLVRPCTRWVVYRFTRDGEYAGLTDLAGVSMDRPALVRVDGSGRIYAAGVRSDGSIWIFDGSTYRDMYGSGRPRGRALDLAFDSAGNALLLGTDGETSFLARIARDTYEDLGITRFPGLFATALAAAPDGSVYVAGNRGGAPVVLRLLQGKVATFDLGLGLASPQTIVAAPDAVYVAGSAVKQSTLTRGFIVSLDPALNEIRKRTFLEGEGSDDVKWLGADDEGRILAAGITSSYHLPATGAFRTPCGPDPGAARTSGMFLARFDRELGDLQAYTPFRGISPTYPPAFSRFGEVYWATTEVIRWWPDRNPETAVTCVVRADYSLAPSASPLELITIFGQGFTGTAQDFAEQDQLPVEVDGLRVEWGSIGNDSAPAAILAITPTQINVVLPRLATQGALHLVLFRGSSPIYEQSLTSPGFMPAALLRVSDTGELYPSLDGSLGAVLSDVLNSDGTSNSRENPALPGEIVSLFATGVPGLPPDVSERAKGSPVPSHPYQPVLIQTADGAIRPEEVSTVPGRTTGVLQIRFRLPLEVSGSEFGFGFEPFQQLAMPVRPYFLYVRPGQQD
jgi:uncharacterized protein (TIGR03437 family)